MISRTIGRIVKEIDGLVEEHTVRWKCLQHMVDDGQIMDRMIEHVELSLRGWKEREENVLNRRLSWLKRGTRTGELEEGLNANVKSRDFGGQVEGGERFVVNLSGHD